MYIPSYSSSRASQFRAEPAVTPAAIKFEAVAPDNGRPGMKTVFGLHDKIGDMCFEPVSSLLDDEVFVMIHVSLNLKSKKEIQIKYAKILFMQFQQN